MTRPINILWVFLALTVFSTMLAAQDVERAANVRVATASMQTLAPLTMVPATVVSRNDAKLAAEVTGRLLDVADV